MAIAQSQGIDTEWIPRLATGFGGGIARTGQTCGALNGAIIGMGLVLGRDNPSVKADDFYAVIQKLLADFEATHGTVLCRALTGLDFMTPEGRAGYRGSATAAQCLEYVAEAAESALTLLDTSE